jgi:hypothetical protein
MEEVEHFRKLIVRLDRLQTDAKVRRFLRMKKPPPRDSDTALTVNQLIQLYRIAIEWRDDKVSARAKSSSEFCILDGQFEQLRDALDKVEQKWSELASITPEEAPLPENSQTAPAAATLAPSEEGQMMQLQDARAVPYDDATTAVEAERTIAALDLAQDVRDVREMMAALNQATVSQGEHLWDVQQNVAQAAERTERGRDELARASRYKLGALALSGALVGGVLGGPIGAMAGAKSVTTIGACVALGGVSGGMAGKTVGNVVHQANVQYIEDERTERELLEDH